MRKFSIILIISGIVVALLPLIGQLYTGYNEERMVRQWLDETTEQAVYSSGADVVMAEKNYEKLQEAFVNDQSESNISGKAYSQPNSAGNRNLGKKAPKPSSQKLIGVIKIDKIKVKLPIVEGVDRENLRSGIGHVPGTAGLGQPGNSALAGHRNYAFARFFNRLDELRAGDEIRIITKKDQYVYKVVQKKVVLPSDVSVLKGNKGESIVTLITCTPPNRSTHRLIVRAKLTKIIQDKKN